MKRSEINAAIKWSIELLDKNNFKLPRFAYWTMDEWEKNKDKIDTLREVMAGWDITDFGSGKFDEIGAILLPFVTENSENRELVLHMQKKSLSSKKDRDCQSTIILKKQKILSTVEKAPWKCVSI